SKGQAITLMKDYLKTDFIAGIGDNYNDLPMFSHCDYAFTFHDSPEGVKKHADRTVSGVAEAIRLLERLP
ncbi:MAG: HAD hydrolase family protein, partial [bacterium]